jgi:hypothetical protein
MCIYLFSLLETFTPDGKAQLDWELEKELKFPSMRVSVHQGCENDVSVAKSKVELELSVDLFRDSNWPNLPDPHRKMANIPLLWTWNISSISICHHRGLRIVACQQAF